MVNMSKKCTNLRMSRKRVEKIKKSIHVCTTTLPDKRHLSGLLYRPLDQRKDSSGDSDGLLRSSKYRISDGYEMTDLPASDYERMHQT